MWFYTTCQNTYILNLYSIQVPSDRILLETDAPDALPKSNIDSLLFVEGDASLSEEFQAQRTTSSSTSASSSNNASHVLKDVSMLPKETLNHPANIRNVCSSSNRLHCCLVFTKLASLIISFFRRYIIIFLIRVHKILRVWALLSGNNNVW